MEWTAERRIELGTMWLAGQARDEIAKHFTTTVDSIRTRAWRLGLPDLKEIRKGATGTMRSCMCCREIFFSEGKHHRLCTPCREGAH